MARESKKARKERSAEIYDRLAAEYPDAHCALDHGNAYELAAATILSAQCTDVRVNMVTPDLFDRYPTVEALAGAKVEDVEEIVRSTGFFRNKAKSLVGMANGVVDQHGSELPRSIAELIKLPGIGRKTANVILGNAFAIDEGVVVDTHVKRLSTLTRLTRETTPEKIEQDLIALFPTERWTMLSHLLIYHGRQACIARRPRCASCVISDLCPSSSV
jgi:endonuclease-3